MPDFQARINTQSVIAAGHSYGALTAQYLGGATIELIGDSRYPLPDTLKDERVSAIVAISPPGTIAGRISQKTWHDLKIPQLVVTGTNDVFPHIWPNYQDHFVSYLSAQEGDNYLLVLDQMDHYLGNLIGRLDREEQPQTTALHNLNEISLLFTQSYLNNDNRFFEKLNNVSAISKLEGVVDYQRR